MNDLFTTRNIIAVAVAIVGAFIMMMLTSG